MQIQMNQSEFRRLSPAAQREIIEQLSGKTLLQPEPRKRGARLYWRKPVELSPALAKKLVHGLSDMHLRRLELFARKEQGRVSLKELLAVNGDSDWHALSHFQSVITRRLRRLIDDPEKKAELIKWDFDTTEWDRDGKTIVDGVYFVSEQTAAALREVLRSAGGSLAKQAR